MSINEDYGDRLDDLTISQIYIDHEHHEVHNGRAFTFHDVFTLATSGSHGLVLQAPNTARLSHLVIETESSDNSDMYLFEKPTMTASVSTHTVYNRNRNSPNSAGLTIVASPTITASGTELIRTKLRSARNVGGMDRNRNEWILKQNENYLYLVVSAANSNVHLAKFDWYELINKR